MTLLTFPGDPGGAAPHGRAGGIPTARLLITDAPRYQMPEPQLNRG